MEFSSTGSLLWSTLPYIIIIFFFFVPLRLSIHFIRNGRLLIRDACRFAKNNWNKLTRILVYLAHVSRINTLYGNKTLEYSVTLFIKGSQIINIQSNKKQTCTLQSGHCI